MSEIICLVFFDLLSLLQPPPSPPPPPSPLAALRSVVVTTRSSHSIYNTGENIRQGALPPKFLYVRVRAGAVGTSWGQTAPRDYYFEPCLKVSPRIDYPSCNKHLPETITSERAWPQRGERRGCCCCLPLPLYAISPSSHFVAHRKLSLKYAHAR